jgi:hypothetical protein
MLINKSSFICSIIGITRKSKGGKRPILFRSKVRVVALFTPRRIGEIFEFKIRRFQSRTQQVVIVIGKLNGGKYL